MEELVGRAVKKAFPGFGVFSGVVESYDAEAGYFRVLYEDGDSEEVDAREMASILVGPSMPPQPEGAGDSAGRRPKKRRRGDEESPQGNVALVVEAADGDGPSNGSALATPAEGRRMGTNGEVVERTLEKKRRVDPGPESARPVRRSARQAKAAALAAEMEAAAAAASVAGAGDVAPSPSIATPQQSGRKRQHANGSGRYRSVARDLENAAQDRLPPKPELPPSSQGLDLEGLPVLDVFQVYSCLRSFSRQLFLSPFALETFVAALRCTDVNHLIDWVHFALLRALKSHLEYLAREGDPPAVHCIRNLNWELLDLATWPIYLAEYLLTRGSELRCGMKLADLRLLNTEYYRQPALVKLELLLSLCDDVLEIEPVRSVIGSRVSELDGNDEGYRSTMRRKTRGSSVKDVDSSPPPEGSDDMDDGNSDECYLCGMDGNLLCCDGCPAAFHSKCVGVVEDLLPEGDWYCPECLIQKNDGSRNIAKLVRGAEVLGTDPHGRLYFGTCGYLLVVESCDADSLCHYYGQIDLTSLITVLTHPLYNSIVDAISLFRGVTIESSNLDDRYENSKECSTSDHEADRRRSTSRQRSEFEQHKIEKEVSCKQLDFMEACASVLDQVDQDAPHQKFTSRSALMSENGNETTADEKLNETTQHSTSSAKDSRSSLHGDFCSHANGLTSENLKDPSPQKKARDCYFHSDPSSYVNYYSFGQIAASAAGELKQKLSENKEGKKPGQDAFSLQLKIICRKYANIFAQSDQKLSVDLLKEKCGWCNSCQISGGADCIFRVSDVKSMESCKPSGLWSEKNKGSHIVLAIHSILSIEERLNGLLSGPWQNPQYSIYWRKAVLRASDLSSLKQPLLTLESSLRRVAFSAEWQKPADSVEVVGSAAHILVRSSTKSLNHGSVKKPGRKPSNDELKVDSRDVGVYWWRGGTLSRQVFHWKRLPQSLAFKAARQAGRKKISTIVYPDGSQFAKRLKYIAWRAAVEMAQNAAQLILQVKELQLNIKWSEISSTLSSALATKESQKIAKLFKKVIVRRKHIEGTNVKYLLDFGKRENIPPVVVKHGIKLEEPSSERNRYWLSEGHVPLSLLKAYEAKSLTRSLKKKDTDHLPEKINDFKPQKAKGSVFDDLLERAKRLPSRLCGQCYKEVITSEAVNCQYCEALFHKKHFKVPRGAVDTVYVCNKCLAEKVPPVKSPQKKAASKKSSPKKKQKKRPRKIVTRKTQIVINLKKKAGRKIGKRGRPRKNPLKVSKNGSSKVSENQPSNMTKNEPVKRLSKRLYDKYMKGNSSKSEHAASCHKRKRTVLLYSYWLDGLRWTHNPDDERARSFRKERVVFPKEDVEASEVSPACYLCKKRYTGDAIYISCENCEDWFHGDIYSITSDSVNALIGFKCHGCRLRAVPVCPYSQSDTILNAQSDQDDGIGSVEDKDHNCPKDHDAHGGLKELHDHGIEKQVDDRNCLKVLEDHNDLKEPESRSTEKELDDLNIEGELHGHNIEKQVDDHNCLEVLEDHNDLKEPESRSTEKELDDHRLKELDNHNIMKLDSHSTEEGLDGHNYLKELDDHNNLNELHNIWAEKELDDYSHLSKWDNHTDMNDLNNQNSPEELGGAEDSKFAAGETQCLKEMDNHNSPKDLNNHKSPKEPDNHKSPKEPDNHNTLEALDDHNCPNETDNHNRPKERDSQNSPKDLNNHKSSKELDLAEDNEFAAVADMGDFLDDQLSVGISSKEALTMPSENGSVKESIALQSEDISENSVTAQHEVDLQVVVTL